MHMYLYISMYVIDYLNLLKFFCVCISLILISLIPTFPCHTPLTIHAYRQRICNDRALRRGHRILHQSHPL